MSETDEINEIIAKLKNWYWDYPGPPSHERRAYNLMELAVQLRRKACAYELNTKKLYETRLHKPS